MSTFRSTLHLASLGGYLIGMAAWFRLLPTMGDDKSYALQALEMYRAGSVFQQLLYDVPHYLKGPLHYLELLLGIQVLGLNPLALLWMNFFWWGVLLLLLRKVSPLLSPESRQYVWTVPLFSLGFLLPLFQSMMESTLMSLTLLGSTLLLASHQAPRKMRYVFGFWLVCGLIGTLKSPVYSALLGSAGIVFWMGNRQVALLRRGAFWGAWGSGVLLCVASYLPAYAIDGSAFIETYLLRENLERGGNEVSWLQVLLAGVVLFNLPYSLPALVRCVKWKSVWRDSREKAWLLAWALPGAGYLLFFLMHPSRNVIYGLPSSLLFLMASAPFMRWRFGLLERLALGLGLGLLLIPAALVLGVALQTPEIWETFLLREELWVAFGLGGTLALWGFVERYRLWASWHHATWISVLLLLALLGEFERSSLNQALAQSGCQRVAYYEPRKSWWSEWAYWSFYTDAPFRALTTSEALSGRSPEEAAYVQARDSAAIASEEARLPVLRLQGRIEGIHTPQAFWERLRSGGWGILKQDWLLPCTQQERRSGAQ